MMAQPVIEMKGVGLVRGRRRILAGVTMSVSRGEFAGVLGPNGAGKTSLLNVIAGFAPHGGEMKLFGRPAAADRPRGDRLRIGIVPQIFDIDPAFPIRAHEAVMTGCYGRLGLFRKPGRAERDRALELMRIMLVAGLAEKPLGQLSGGERQKVSLARALFQQPEILLMDEPAAGLDIAVQKEFLDLIQSIHARTGITIIMVTHDFNMLPAAMERVIFMRDGRVVFDGAAESAMTGAALSSLFKHPIRTIEHEGARFISHG
jgi:manganese/iron transport system ATP-binding protein